MSTTNELDDLDYCCGDLGSISRGEQLYPPELIDLRTNGSSRDDLQLDVRQKIIEGLTEKNPKVPGQSLVDRAFTYQKTIPTLVLCTWFSFSFFFLCRGAPGTFILLQPSGVFLPLDICMHFGLWNHYPKQKSTIVSRFSKIILL